MKNLEPIARDLVLVGGGHSHVIVLRKLGMKPVPGLQVTLVSPSTRTAYSGMLPGLVAGHYEEDDIHIDLVPLCRFAGARFIEAKVDGIDPVGQSIQLDSRPDLRYDILSIDVGITPLLDVPGAAENVIPVKPINEFLGHWQVFLESVSKGEVCNVGFVGAGAGGVELCLAVNHRLRQSLAYQTHPVSVHLIADDRGVLPEHNAGVKSVFRRTFENDGIQVHENFRVAYVDDRTVTSTAGESIHLDAIFWVTSAMSQAWLQDTGLSLTDDGFIAVGRTLQSDNFPNVFAVGDVAHMTLSPRPKAGVFAVRQGPPLERNIRRLLGGKAPLDYRPQREFLSLISTGGRKAVASRNNQSFAGALVWRWKDWIDRRFMRRFNDLPVMSREPKTGLLAEFDDQMQCGGCGSKVSAELLTEVLTELGSGVRDDAAEYTVPAGKSMLHSIDYFKSFVDDPYEFAQIGVTHALSDIYAMGGTPVTALAMVTVPYGKPTVIKSILQQLLSGAKHQLDADNVQLVGGHTTEGAELSIGFSVNGIIDPAQILRKSGMQEGQVLILTKPLGTGTLFAADMQHKARGSWISSALVSMKQSNMLALNIMQEHQVTACTDVTGFGLAGHLLEMTAACGLGASLRLDDLPVLEGSVNTIQEMSIRSTLHQGNRESAFMVPDFEHIKFELLFDPQTSGGLLASIPVALAEKCVRALREQGYANAACIGNVNRDGLTLE